MKFFGTDGIRMKADDLLHTNYAYKLGVILSSFSSRIGIGKDARTSSSALERQFVQGVLDGGKTAVLFGVLPTPSLSLIMNEYGVEYSVMVTASHNPPEYNGLKIIKNGGKLTLDEESRIDEMMTANFLPVYGGNVEVIEDGFSTYKKLVKSKFDIDGDGEKICLDCANGADAEYARRIFESFGFDVTAYNDVRDGRKVNVGCGATNIDFLKSRANGNIGFAFDGDGDRLIAVDNDEVIDGDGILFALAKSYLADNRLNANTVVGTILSNGGLENALKKDGVTFLRTDVGDKYVAEKMREVGAVIGGEQSGHIIIADKSYTGDGIISALSLISAKRKFGVLPHFKANEVFSFNIKCENPREMMHSTDFFSQIDEIKDVIASNGRIVVRPSGTEQAVRILIEFSNGALDTRNRLENTRFVKNLQKWQK